MARKTASKAREKFVADTLVDYMRYYAVRGYETPEAEAIAKRREIAEQSFDALPEDVKGHLEARE